jgi:hypothetical protein
MSVVFRPGMSVGAMSAEDDEAFLRDCLVETSDISQISDAKTSKCVALGRTGVGKSALLWKLENSERNVRRINPESLSLNYISNSDILRFFENLEIDLDLFYQILWRHVLAVELLQMKKNIVTAKKNFNILDRLLDMFSPNQKKQQALEYLFTFGSKFWEDTEARVREVVHSIEQSFESEMGTSVSAFKAKLAAELNEGQTESVTQTTEIIHRAQKVVNGLQLQELNTVMDFLADDVFSDFDERFYLIIDDLDTGWVHDRLRFKLVRALIETIKKFRKVRNLKIVIGLRADLLETVLSNTQSKGFQTEKYEDLFLRMHWSRDELLQMANKRINNLFKDKYATRELVFYDVFTPTIAKQDTFDYILDRTLHRPRDVIAFINECLVFAKGQSRITQQMVRDAEGAYSRKRLRSVADEWREAFGDLENAIGVLRDLDVRFRASDLKDSVLEGLCLKILAGDDPQTGGVFARECGIVSAGQGTYYDLRRKTLETLYIIGMVGVKFRSGAPFQWSYINEPALSFANLEDEVVFAIHPMLYRELNKKADVTTIVRPASP